MIGLATNYWIILQMPFSNPGISYSRSHGLTTALTLLFPSPMLKFHQIHTLQLLLLNLNRSLNFILCHLYLHNWYVKDGILEKRKYGIIDRNYTLLRSNVQHQRRMYLAMIERRLRRRDKDVGAESDLLNDLGFNLCVAPWSLVVRLVAYFGVKEVVKTEVLRSWSKDPEIRTRWR